MIAAKGGSFTAWQRECIERARWCNAQPELRGPAKIRTPLGDREVIGIAKSVARWTWERFTAAAFAELQRRRIRARWGDQVAARRQLLLDLLDVSPEHSVRGLVRISGLPRRTVRRLLSEGNPRTP